MVRPVIGRTTVVEIAGRKIPAKIDTGAWSGAIDRDLAKELNLQGKIVKRKKIYVGNKEFFRPVVRTMIKIADKCVLGNFSISKRAQRKFPLLIGRNILNKGFLIDTRKCESEL